MGIVQGIKDGILATQRLSCFSWIALLVFGSKSTAVDVERTLFPSREPFGYGEVRTPVERHP
jgi:hypothetical protein